MSIDKSLRGGSRLQRSRNVLKRHERIDQMKANDNWSDEKNTALGLPKTRVVKAVIGKKKKVKKDDEDDKK